MVSIDDVYNYCNNILNKKYSGSMSPDQFNEWASTAQILHLLVKLGLPEQYKISVGYPAQGQRKALMIVREAAQEVEATMTLSDDVRPFLTVSPVNGTNNLFTVPDDYVRYRPSNYKYSYQQINPATGQSYTDWRWVPFEFVNGPERTYRLYQYIKKPNAEYPLISYQNGQLLVDADEKGEVIIPQIQLNYVRLPKVPFWNSTPNANDQPIYNPIGSVNFEFPTTEFEAIARRIIAYWAESIRDTEIVQLNEKTIQQGE